MNAHFDSLVLKRSFGLRLGSLLLLSLSIIPWVACGGSGAASSDPAPVTPLQRTSVVASGNPLVALYTVTTSGSAGTLSVQFGPDTNYGFQTSAQTVAAGGTATIQVAGMKQNTLYHMRAVFTTATGQVLDQDHTFQTGAIPPALIPQFQLAVAPGQQPTPGIQLISGTGEEFALNPTGDIVWYYQNLTGDYPYVVKLLPDGHMLMLLNLPSPKNFGIREVDLTGTIVREIDLDQLIQKVQNAGYNIQLISIDHDMLLLPNGHLVFIASDTRVFTDLPGYPGQTTVQGNAVIDLDSQNNVAWVWDAFDHLDVNRHPINFPDWTHANALFYVPDDGSLLLSIRHQHWVLKLDYQNGTGPGDIIWKLGYQGDFTLLNSSSPADWFYAQHDANIASPNLTGNFQLALFDNGDSRVLDDGGDVCGQTGQPACYSTSAIFQVDETNRTAQRMWSTQTPYSNWGGSTQELANSNVMFDETAPADLDGLSSRLMEVTQQTPATTVWELTFHEQGAYRAQHLGSLYPGVQW